MSDVSMLRVIGLWLEEQADDRRNRAAARRETARTFRNASAADMEAARRTAEQMSGRRISKSSPAEDIEAARSNERIAAALEEEAARLEGWTRHIFDAAARDERTERA